MRSKFYYVIGVHVVLRYDNRLKIVRNGRAGGSIVINNYWKTGIWKLISKSNTLSPLCITIYVYIHIKPISFIQKCNLST